MRPGRAFRAGGLPLVLQRRKVQVLAQLELDHVALAEVAALAQVAERAKLPGVPEWVEDKLKVNVSGQWAVYLRFSAINFSQD